MADPPQLRSGATRHVLLVGPWAVKLPRPGRWRAFLNGLLANHQEAAFSRLQHPRLCPVLLCVPGGFLLVMRRAVPLPLATFEALDPADWGGVLGAVEFKADSFGLLDGRVVAVDYGS